MKARWRRTALAALAACSQIAALPDRAIELRNEGLAQLENEQPAKAEEAFRELVPLTPQDPLANGNLAIALLRQQKNDEATAAIAAALAKAPDRPDLLAIRAEVEQWGGHPAEALADYRLAAAAAPEDPQIQYSLLRQAAATPGGEDGPDARLALERLARLRPENPVVLLQLGRQALAGGDRETASTTFLRLGDLVWQAPDAAETLLQQILTALEAGDLEAAQLPGQRLENVLRITPMYREGLRELSSGIQGVPVTRFVDEPPPTRFGKPVAVRFRSAPLAPGKVNARALAAGDFDGDEAPDLAWVEAGSGDLVVRLSTTGTERRTPATTPAATRLLAADLDNDTALDLLAYGGPALTAWKGAGDGSFEPATAAWGLDGHPAEAAAVLDFDIEGDLDLLLGGGAAGPGQLLRNNLEGPLEPTPDATLPDGPWKTVRDLAVSDLDRDGDLDVAALTDTGLVWLENLRQGELRARAAGVDPCAGCTAVAAGDLDNDGWPDLVAAGDGLSFFHNGQGSFTPWTVGRSLATSARFDSLLVEDFDNDGRLDLAAAAPQAIAVLAQRDGMDFAFLPVEASEVGGPPLAAADLDGDGDLDLVAAGAEGLTLLDNQGGNANHWLAVRLRGLTKGNSKNNAFGFGAAVEVRSGTAYQFREVSSDVVHLGLGSIASPDLLRVVWTNGVPQNRLAPAIDQRVVEEQLLKGSCPFLYAWDGERIRFVTDLLWGAPAGLPVAAGVWAGADPDELVRVDGAMPRDGSWDLRITEELWEAAFFDQIRLWVVDHPREVEVASNLRIVPGEVVEDRVLGTRELHPLAAAIDASGHDATARVARRDEIYAGGWEKSPYQGVASAPWSFVLDLGEAPAGPVRLHLDGWIFPTDASLNLAIAQRRDLTPLAPRLEVETPSGWKTLMPVMGFPAGKTKTMVVDTPPLPAGSSRLRIVSNQWLAWDRIAWSVHPADGEARVVARLLPDLAELRFRGFSAPRRRAPNGPHDFDYATVSTHSPWLTFPGHYTRYGDVLELLAEADDRSVILASGDELVVSFAAGGLPPLESGWTRTIFLESHGWDKDADRNTWEPEQVEPLPFRAMSGYPYGPGESFPDTPLLRQYRQRWLTRVIEPERPGRQAGTVDGAQAPGSRR